MDIPEQDPGTTCCTAIQPTNAMDAQYRTANTQTATSPSTQSDCTNHPHDRKPKPRATEPPAIARSQLTLGLRPISQRPSVDDAPTRGIGVHPEPLRVMHRLDPLGGWSHDRGTVIAMMAWFKGETDAVSV